MSGSDTDKTTGRTPWDVAAIVVSRLGPTTIVVLGFLAVTGFLFQKITDADSRAQELLVENTGRMNLMSAQLITNIDQMMALNTKVNKEIKEARELFETELKTAREELETTRQQANETQIEISISRDGLKKEQAELRVTMSELDQERTQFKATVDVLKKKIVELERSRAEVASVLGELQERAVALALKAAGDDDPAGEPVASPLRQILEAFAADPNSQEARDALKNLTGQRYESLEAAIKEDGIGFDVWFYSKRIKTGRHTIWGYMTQEADGPRNFIRLSVGNDRITNTTYRQANVLSKIPKAENWYERWMADLVVVSDDKLSVFYSAGNISQWDQHSLTAQRYPKREYKNRILHGELKKFEVVSLVEFRRVFPNHYALWKKRTDAFGRPSVILAMMERAKDFDASNLAGMPSPSVADGLAEAIAKLLKAAIDKDTAVLRRVASRFGRDELGAIAAMALREPRLEVVDMRPQSSVLQRAEPEELFEVIFSLEERRTRRGWELREFSSPF